VAFKARSNVVEFGRSGYIETGDILAAHGVYTLWRQLSQLLWSIHLLDSKSLKLIFTFFWF